MANASKKDKYYIKFLQDTNKDLDKEWPPDPCEVFAFKKWRNLVIDPSVTNLRKHMASIIVGSIKWDDYQPPHVNHTKKKTKTQMVLMHTGKYHHPLFHLNADNIFKMVGGKGKGRKTKQENYIPRIPYRKQH